MIDPTAARQVMGLNTIFGGRLALAETMAPNDDVTTTLQKSSGIVCANCFYSSDICRAVLFDEAADD
jgi:hypothetical protein